MIDKRNDREKNILVSIIVPIYNVEDYLEKCIKSIIEQSYWNLEIILVNDGSTDNSSMICDEFAKVDQRIKVIHKKNGGVVTARKVGIEKAHGEYIIGVDGDDWIEQDRIYNAVKEIKNEKIDMLYLSGHYRDYKDSMTRASGEIKEKFSYYGKEILENIFSLVQDSKKCFERRFRLAFWKWMIKRELLQEKIKLIDDRISSAEDELCIWFCLLSANSIKVCFEEGYHYRLRANSLSFQEEEKKQKNLYYFSKQLIDYVEKYVFTDEMKKVFNVYFIMSVMIANYKILFDLHKEFIYPYSQVKCGSKIVLYGAGKMGYAILQALKSSKDYNIVLWVDSSSDRPVVDGYVVQPIEKIAEIEYDYIVVGVLYEKDALDIKKNLISKGIREEKIACMNIKEVNQEVVDKLKENLEI